MKKVLVLAMLAFFGLGLIAQVKEVQVNKTGNAMYPNEPTVVINRMDASKITVSANLNNHYFSENGGKTWSQGQIESSHGFYGDPVLHATNDGKVYITHLSQTLGKDKHYRFIDRMVVQRSDDGGRRFNNGSFTGYNQDKIQDKPWLSSDEHSTYKGNLYLTWTEFDKMNSKKKKDKSRIRFSGSSNFGESWSETITISDTTGDCVDDDHTLEGATTAMDIDGNIYCVWAGHNNLYFDKSTDGGKTWGMDKVIGRQMCGWAMEVPHVYRTNGMPFLLSDISRGYLYVVYGDTIYGDADIFIIYSSDKGATWSDPIRVNKDERGNHKSQYMANAALDPVTGDVGVVYYDRRNSNLNVFSDVYLAVSKRGEGPFQEVRLNSQLSGVYGAGTFSGDYIDIDLYKGKMAVVWSASEQMSKLYTVVGDLDSILTEQEQFDLKSIAYYTEMKNLKTNLYIRTNQPLTVKYTYSYKGFLGLSKINGEMNDSIACPHDGKQTVDYQVKYPSRRKYAHEIEFKNGEILVLSIKTKSN